MFLSMESQLKHKQNEVETIKLAMDTLPKSGEKDANKYFDQYLKLKKILPKSLKVSLAIVKFIAKNKIKLDNKHSTYDLLKDCNHIVSNLMPMRQQKSITYPADIQYGKKKN